MMFLGRYLVAQLGWQLAPPQAIAQRNRDRFLGFLLPDDVAIQFLHDLLGTELIQIDAHDSSSTTISEFV